jgi:hypothetical protein
MYPDKIVTRILLILFIGNQVVNFVLGAPVAAQEELKGRIDVDVTEDGTTTALQKRVNPVDGTNIAGQGSQSPYWTEIDQLWEEMRGHGLLIDSPTPLHNPGWSTPPFGEGSPGSTGNNHMPSPPPPLPA